MIWTFKRGDWLATCNRGGGLAKLIRDYQKHKGYTEPVCSYTHAEVVWWVSEDGDTVCTFGQTFPRAIPVYYRRSDGTLTALEGKLSARINTSRYLYRIKDYDAIVGSDWKTSKFVRAMDLKFRELLNKKGPGLIGKLGINYDFLQLAGYWLNSIFGKSGSHLNWLEIPGGLGVCSDKAAEGLDAGFDAVLGYSPLFPIDPNSEVCPADIDKEPLFALIQN
jgi:hypothetical protein